MTDNTPCYWIVSFPLYGKFVFYGTEYAVYDLLFKTEEREHEKGNVRRADPGLQEDKIMVMKEIIGVREDRERGIQVPYYPDDKGWLLG